jgi:hypothetical protein
MNAEPETIMSGYSHCLEGSSPQIYEGRYVEEETVKRIYSSDFEGQGK